MNALGFVALTLIFILVVRKFFVFVDAHDVRVYEETTDVSLYFMEISCYYYCPPVALNFTGPNTLNTYNIDQ